VEYYAGAGVQHVALRTNDIIQAVTALTNRGVEFLTIPAVYYENLQKGLESVGMKVDEDLEIIKKLHILIDYDDKGYLLQIFTKPVEDRPTLFFENHLETQSLGIRSWKLQKSLSRLSNLSRQEEEIFEFLLTINHIKANFQIKNLFH